MDLDLIPVIICRENFSCGKEWPGKRPGMWKLMRNLNWIIKLICDYYVRQLCDMIVIIYSCTCVYIYYFNASSRFVIINNTVIVMVSIIIESLKIWQKYPCTLTTSLPWNIKLYSYKWICQACTLNCEGWNFLSHKTVENDWMIMWRHWTSRYYHKHRNKN